MSMPGLYQRRLDGFATAAAYRAVGPSASRIPGATGRAARTLRVACCLALGRQRKEARAGGVGSRA